MSLKSLKDSALKEKIDGREVPDPFAVIGFGVLGNLLSSLTHQRKI